MPQNKKLSIILDANEQKALLAVFDTRYLTAECNRMLIRLMLDTGLRLSEELYLKWQDIDLMTGKIVV